MDFPTVIAAGLVLYAVYSAAKLGASSGQEADQRAWERESDRLERAAERDRHNRR